MVNRAIRRDHVEHLLRHAVTYAAESLHLDRLAAECKRITDEHRALGQFSHFHSDTLMDHLCGALAKMRDDYASEERATRQRMESAEQRLRESLDDVRYHRKTTDGEREFLISVLVRARETLECAMSRWIVENERERAAKVEKRERV